tara:strand:- start:198 stop:683 length:486 start_codon:yes stop_codon:yes gene_type:complete
LIEKLFTIGVYEKTEDEFFGQLIENNIDTFCDIRRRRGLRGAKYSFVNSIRLQERLNNLGINYVHLLHLSPSVEVRNIQKEIDKQSRMLKRERTGLSKKFIDAFIQMNLENYNLDDFYSYIGESASSIVLFCVENDSNACHRSIVADFIIKNTKEISLIHL